MRRQLQPPEVFRLDELGQPIPVGHLLGEKQSYFPTPPGTEPKE